MRRCLRVSEVVRLKVASIDSQRILIHVENGKGGRDRYAMLSPRLLQILRAYWKRVRPGLWLFVARGSANLSLSMLFGIPSRLIFWKAASISASSRFC
jgi:integrase